MKAKIFTTCFSSIDGELYPFVLNWIQKGYAVDYVNLITETAPDILFLDKPELDKSIKKFKDMTDAQNHIPEIFLVGYEKSMNEPMPNEAFRKRLGAAAAAVQQRLPRNRIVCLWISARLQITQISDWLPSRNEHDESS